MRVFLFLAGILLFLPSRISAQSKSDQQTAIYMAVFKDKSGATFDPGAYFHPNALLRRARHGLSFADSSDFPVNPGYAAKVRFIADSSLGCSRWLNAAFFRGNQESANKIGALSFVARVERLSRNKPVPWSVAAHNAPLDYDTVETTDATDLELLKVLRLQTERMQGSRFHENSFTGKGIRIAVFDAGFSMANERPELAHIFEQSNVAETYDFVRNGKPFQYKYSSHGTMVLSCIGGKFQDVPVGLAPDAQFLLARTEHWLFEPAAEEINWLKAAEWADKHGADVINSSLGYTDARYFYHDLDGNTAIATRAANIAARKGILVVNAAGNEGDIRWNYIGAPADADSVLAVGGTDPYTDAKIGFSSWGPTYDGRMKPNVVAFGLAAACGPDGMTLTTGTSFSSPLVAGFAACALQCRKDWTAMELFRKIEQSAHLYPYFDYAHGYGVPQAGRIISDEQKPVSPTFEFRLEGRTLHVILNEERVNAKSVKNIYYNFQRPDGTLEYFAVQNAQSRIALNIPLSALKPDKILNVHYEGYTAKYNPNREAEN